MDAAYDWPLILAYHSVSPGRTDALAVRVEQFEQQIAWLARGGYQSLTLADLAGRSPRQRRRAVAVTFDDGYADNHAWALPVLRRHGFVATVFVVSDHVGSDRLFSWDRAKLRSEDERPAYRALTWDELRELQDSGWEVGSHSCTHPELPAVPPERCREETARSRRDLESRLGRPVASFCYPRGKLDARVIGSVQQAGYRWGVVTPKRSGIPLGPLTLRRVGVYNGAGCAKFRLKANPFVRRFWEPMLWARGRRG